jgi:hypothetical protein
LRVESQRRRRCLEKPRSGSVNVPGQSRNGLPNQTLRRYHGAIPSGSVRSGSFRSDTRSRFAHPRRPKRPSPDRVTRRQRSFPERRKAFHERTARRPQSDPGCYWRCRRRIKARRSPYRRSRRRGLPSPPERRTVNGPESRNLDSD